MYGVHQVDVFKREVAVPVVALEIKMPLFLQSLDSMEGSWEVCLPAINPYCIGVGKTVELALKMLVERLQEPPWLLNTSPLVHVSDDWLPMLLRVLPDEYRFSSLIALRDRDATRPTWQHLRTWSALGGLEQFDCTRHTGERCRVTAAYSMYATIDHYTVVHLDKAEPAEAFATLNDLEHWLFVSDEIQPPR